MMRLSMNMLMDMMRMSMGIGMDMNMVKGATNACDDDEGGQVHDIAVVSSYEGLMAMQMGTNAPRSTKHQ